ncbi:MAG TPA: hypothetical protein VF691_14315 [Cytophagaceae bacterium]|jgi:hypothetical protein
MNIRSITFQALLLPFFILTVLSCSKDRITPIRSDIPLSEAKDSTDEIFIASPNKILQRFAIAPTSQTINSAQDMPFIGKKGTKIFASNHDFMFPNGDYANFPIRLEILELFTPKDMILHQMPTVSNGRLLTTGGEVNVKAYKDGQELRLSPWNGMKIEIPSTDVDFSMSLFYGNTASDGTVNWVEAQFRDREGQDSNFSRIIPTKENYQIFPQQIGWINCDRFSSYTGAKTRIKFSSLKPKLASIVTFLYFDGIKSVAQVYGEESLEVPVGEHVKVICVASKANGDLYTYSTNFNVHQDQVVEVKLEQTTEADFLANLGSL